MSKITKDGTEERADRKSIKHVPLGHHSPTAGKDIVLAIPA